MKVSVITPSSGEAIGLVADRRNRSRLDTGTAGSLLIDDSPWEKVELPGGDRFSGGILENEKNLGIHPPGVGRTDERSESPFCFWIRTIELAPEAIRRMIGEAKSSWQVKSPMLCRNRRSCGTDALAQRLSAI